MTEGDTTVVLVREVANPLDVGGTVNVDDPGSDVGSTDKEVEEGGREVGVGVVDGAELLVEAPLDVDPDADPVGIVPVAVVGKGAVGDEDPALNDNERLWLDSALLLSEPEPDAAAEDGVGVTVTVTVVWTLFEVGWAMLDGTGCVEVSLAMGDDKEPAISANLKKVENWL